MMFLRLAFALLRLAAAQAVRHAVVTAGLWMLAMLLFGIGGIGMMAALWIGLAQVLDPLRAALVIGGFGVASGIILLLVVGMRRAKPLFPPRVMAEVEAALGVGKTGIDVWGPLVGLALLGVVLGRARKGDPPVDETAADEPAVDGKA